MFKKMIYLHIYVYLNQIKTYKKKMVTQFQLLKKPHMYTPNTI